VFPIIEDRPGGDTSFFNNVPQAIFAQAELPSFKFELEKTEGKQDDGSFGKEANVSNFPVSTGLAGVSMKLQRPGAHHPGRSGRALGNQRLPAR
jgi:oxalate decarboxylase